MNIELHKNIDCCEFFLEILKARLATLKMKEVKFFFWKII